MQDFVLEMTSSWELVADSYLVKPGQLSVAPPLRWVERRGGIGGRLLACRQMLEHPIREAAPFCLIKRSPRNNSRLFFSMFQTVSYWETSATEMLYYTISKVFQRCVTPPLQGSALSKAGDEKWTPCSAGLGGNFFFFSSTLQVLLLKRCA